MAKEQEFNLTKDTSYSQLVIPDQQLYGAILKYATPKDISDLTGFIKDAAVEILNNPSYKIDASLVLNEIGHRLSLRSRTLEAAQAYRVAFEIEEPYLENVATYAANFLVQVMSHIRTFQSVDEMLKSRDWLDDTLPAVLRAKTCVAHFINYAIYKETYNQHPGSETGNIEWADPESFARTRYLTQAIHSADDIIREMKLL